MGLLEALAVVVRRDVVADALAARAPHDPGNQPAAGDDVDHGELLGQPQGIVVDGQDVAEQQDLHFGGDAGEDRSLDVGDAVHAEGRAVVLVDHQPVETHLLGVDLFVEIAVVQVGGVLGVVLGVADLVDAGAPFVGPVVYLPGLFGEVADEHVLPRGL